MKVVCHSCQAAYSIPDERLTRSVNKAVCKNCGAAMLIKKEPEKKPNNMKVRETRPGSNMAAARIGDALPTVLSMSNQHKVPRDYVALGVVVAALVILVAAGIFVVRDVQNAVSKPIRAVSRFLEGISEIGKDQPGEKITVNNGVKKSNRHVKRGYKHYKAKRYRKALAEYNKAIEANPQNAKAYFRRGRIFLKTDRHNEAIEDFKQSAALRPGYAPTYDNLGWLFMKRGEYENSLNFLNKSIELKSDNGWSYNTRARVHYEMGNRDKALKDAQKACQLGYKRGCRRYEQYQR